MKASKELTAMNSHIRRVFKQSMIRTWQADIIKQLSPAVKVTIR